MKKNTSRSSQNPPWQDLNPFILSKIFSCLSLNDQLFCPPQVCRSWLNATLHTLFANSNLDLGSLDTLDELNQRSRFTNLLQLAVDHYSGWVSICFPRKHSLHYFATVYIAERTPNISRVVLPCDASDDLFPIFASLMYWKNLRVFDAPLSPEEGFLFLSQLVDHCNNLQQLGVHGELAAKDALCIVEGFPKLKVLDLSHSTLCADALAILLSGRLTSMKELNILHCLFVGEDGEHLCNDYDKLRDFNKEMLHKASALKSLRIFSHCLGKNCQQCNF